jgi:hypothetical protein
VQYRAKANGENKMEKALKKPALEIVDKGNLEELIQSVCSRLLEEIKDGASKREKAKLAKTFTRLGRLYT